MAPPLSPVARLEPPNARLVQIGVLLAWSLFVFDLLLGGVAVLFPEIYFDTVHPNLDHPQVDLLQRSGGLWLAFSAVALITATARTPSARARWFMVLGWLRLVEVPADLIYGLNATGTDALGRALLLGAPPVNLAIGGYLFWLSRQIYGSAATVEDSRGSDSDQSK
ncbi:MAG: hypothetical protein AAGC55_19590 [Myxococcota bacterium]